jgi:hypothetical protein
MTAERWIRVNNNEKIAQFIQLNGVDLDPYGRPVIVNAVGALDVDIVLDQGPDLTLMMEETYDILKGYPPGTFPPQVLIEMNPSLAAQRKGPAPETDGAEASAAGSRHGAGQAPASRGSRRQERQDRGRYAAAAGRGGPGGGNRRRKARVSGIRRQACISMPRSSCAIRCCRRIRLPVPRNSRAKRRNNNRRSQCRASLRQRKAARRGGRKTATIMFPIRIAPAST